MSREEWEQSVKNFYESEFPRGMGDPDWYGYPGQPVDEEPSDVITPDKPF